MLHLVLSHVLKKGIGMHIDWSPGGPEVPEHDGPSVQCDKHVIATKRNGMHLSWALFDRNADGTLTRRFGGSTLAGEGEMNRATDMAMKILIH